MLAGVSCFVFGEVVDGVSVGDAESVGNEGSVVRDSDSAGFDEGGPLCSQLSSLSTTKLS